MENEQSIKRYIVRDVHGNILKENGFSVVGDVHVSVEAGYGDPTADVEYVGGELHITLHNIDGNGITEIIPNSQEGDEAINTVTIKTNDNPEGVVLEVRNGSKGSRGNGITSIETDLSQIDGGANTVTIKTTDNPAGQTFQVRNGHQGPQGDSAVWDESEPHEKLTDLTHVLGASTVKPMSQKGVMDALDDKTEYITPWLDKTGMDALSHNNWPIDKDTLKFVSTTYGKSTKISVGEEYCGRIIRVVPNGDNEAMIAFLKSWPQSSGNLANYCDNTSLIIVDSVREMEVPNDCKFLYVAYQYGSGNNTVITPLAIQVVYDVKRKISDLEDATQAISEDVGQLSDDLTIVDVELTAEQVAESGSLCPLINSANNYTTGTNARVLPMTEHCGKTIELTNENDYQSRYAFLATWDTSAPVDYCDETGMNTISAGGSAQATIPNDCTYLYVDKIYSGHECTPGIRITQTFKGKISELEEAPRAALEAVEQLRDDLTFVDFQMTAEQIGASTLKCGCINSSNVFTNYREGAYEARGFLMKNYRGKSIHIVANSVYNARIAFLRSWDTGNGRPVPYSVEDGILHVINSNMVADLVIPNDCLYMYVDYIFANHEYAPSSMEITVFITDKIGVSETKPDVIYLSEDGDNENDGLSATTPKATFAAAMDAGSNNMQIVLLSDIHEGVDLNDWNGQKKSVTIRGGRDIRPRIILGRKLEGLEAYPGDNDVYTYTPDGETLSIGSSQYLWQHELEDKNTLISSDERHPLQKGRRCRSLSTKLKHATDLSELLSAYDPCWNVTNNVLYLRVAAGSDVVANPIYIPGSGVNALKAGEYDVTLSNIECWYGKIYAGQGSGNGNYLFKAVDCAARYSCGAGAWVLDDAISSHLERCEADGNTMYSQTTGDGFNMSPSTPEDIYAKGSTHTLIDCWSHDNRDDGYSDHGRSEGTIIGGLFEYNRNKGGITPSYGSHDTVYYATVRKNKYGIYSCANASDGGVGTQTVCYGCVAISNTNNYACQGDTDQQHKLILNNCISRNSSGAAILAKGNCEVIVRDCTDNSNTHKYEDGGTITIDNGTVIL